MTSKVCCFRLYPVKVLGVLLDHIQGVTQIIIDRIVFYFVRVNSDIALGLTIQLHFAGFNPTHKIKKDKVPLLPEAFIIYKFLET